MDPNETLRLIRDQIIESDESGIEFYEPNYVAELFVALDDWLSNGGFLPEDWAKNASAPGDGPGSE
jgi:hypothetical protein